LLGVATAGASSDLPGKGPVIVLGEGTISCGQWLEYRKTKVITGAESAAWVRGLITGMNAADPQNHAVGHGSDPAGNNLWINNFCKQHPIERLYEASVALWYALLEKSN
jgi:hypothetical protein